MVGSIVSVLVIVEIVLRLIGYDPFSTLSEDYIPLVQISENEIREYELTPNAEGYAWDADITINSFGFRDKEYSISPPDQVYRIVSLGDSVAFGNMMP